MIGGRFEKAIENSTSSETYVYNVTGRGESSEWKNKRSF